MRSKAPSKVPNEGLEWISMGLGAGFVCIGIIFAEPSVAAVNAGIVGTLVVYGSAVALFRYGAWVEWSNLALGCWAIAAPFLLRFGSAPAAMGMHIVVGLCVATVAAMQLLAGRAAHALSRTKSVAPRAMR